MPPHLHPRSTATSTLFVGTLLASFIVVAIPHLVPCPRPHGHNRLNTEMKLDENGNPIRRVRKGNAQPTPTELQVAPTPASTGSMQTSRTLQDEAAVFKRLQREAEVLKEEDKDRECPVPKPKGALGRWLGFDKDKRPDEVKE